MKQKARYSDRYKDEYWLNIDSRDQKKEDVVDVENRNVANHSLIWKVDY